MDIDKLCDLTDKFTESYDYARDNLLNHVKENHMRMSDETVHSLIFTLKSIDVMTKCYTEFAREVFEEEKRRCPYER